MFLQPVQNEQERGKLQTGLHFLYNRHCRAYLPPQASSILQVSIYSYQSIINNYYSILFHSSKRLTNKHLATRDQFIIYLNKMQ